MKRRSNRIIIEHEFYDNEDNEIHIRASIIPGTPAKTYGPPENCYPGDSDEVDKLEAVWAESGKNLTEEEIKKWVDYGVLLEQTAEAVEDDEAAYWDQKFDEERDRRLEEEFDQD